MCVHGNSLHSLSVNKKKDLIAINCEMRRNIYFNAEKIKFISDDEFGEKENFYL